MESIRPNQSSLADMATPTRHAPQEVRQATEEAIDVSLYGANTEWKEMALRALREVCLKKHRFTIDDVREIVQQSHLTTPDNRAMGGIITMGRKCGWIVPTGEKIPSLVGHGTPMMVWESKLFTLYKPTQHGY